MKPTPLPPFALDADESRDDILDVVPSEPSGRDRHADVLTVVEAKPSDLPEAEPVVRLGFWGVVRRVFGFIGSVCGWIFGLVSLIVGLAVLAALPVLGFLSLGYLLEAGARVARTGRLRDAFIGIRTAGRAGGIVAGAWLMLLPVRLVSSMWTSAEVIDPGGPVARRWQIGLTVLTILMAVHIVTACSRGGKLRYFFWPFNVVWFVRRLLRGGYYTEARDAVWDFVVSLRLPYYFWLGFRGFLGALILVGPPITLLAAGRRLPVVGFLGAFLLVLVLLHVPFLQTQLAARNRFLAMFDVWSVYRNFLKRPALFALSFFLTLLFAVPLYLLKIEMIPREAAWAASLVFIVFIYPARVLTGWVYGVAERARFSGHWGFVVKTVMVAPPAFFVMVATALTYVGIVFLSQYTSWHGVWSLYEQHAFMLPVPFVGM